MRTNLALNIKLRALLLTLALAFWGSTTLAQSSAIEPCQTTPAPAKPTSPDIQKDPTRVNTHVKETLVDSSIPDDPSVENILAPYTAKVRALNVVIGSLESELKTTGIGANTMGHFVTDGVRVAVSSRLDKPVVLVFTNAGGLRKNFIPPGELRASDIFELLPFENELVEIDLTGAQLMNILQRVTSGRDAQAGARIHFRWNEEGRPELISAKLVDMSGREHDIDPQATYTIVTIDYLLKLGSGAYRILQEGKNVKPLGLMIRDAVIDYVKTATAAGRRIEVRLDDRFVQVGPSPARTESPQQ
jgi:2',3'-cyclic-nucleotide 2'-phosphodiesterase (5'-nucleotidase family)